MANVNRSLDEIISTQRGGGGGRRRGIVSRRLEGKIGDMGRIGGIRSKFSSKDTPSGKWKHDKYMDIYGQRGKNTQPNKGASGGSRRAYNLRNQVVKLNMSNIPETVLTADLEELFQDFEVYSVAVHYDEAGNHLGTADILVGLDDAENIMAEYKGIAIDGQEIKFVVVDDSGLLGGGGVRKPRIVDRIQRVASNPIRRRKTQQVQKRVRGGSDRRSDSIEGRKNTRVAKVSDKAKKMTAEELDKELESYMGGR
jgi:hypothetical protein